MPLTVVGTTKKTGDTFVPPVFLEFYERTKCVLATTTVAVATIVTAATGIGTKVAELVAKLAVELCLERHFDGCVTARCAIFTRCTVFAWATIIAIATSTVISSTATTIITIATTTVVTALARTTVSASAATAAWDVVAFFVDRSKADLALVVDVVNAYADDITKSEYVVDVVHTLAIA
jgi:hypothetical protein